MLSTGWSNFTVYLVYSFRVVTKSRGGAAGFRANCHLEFCAIVANAQHCEFEGILLDQVRQS